MPKLELATCRSSEESRGECNCEIHDFYCLVRSGWGSRELQCVEGSVNLGLRDSMLGCNRCGAIENRSDGHHTRGVGVW